MLIRLGSNESPFQMVLGAFWGGSMHTYKLQKPETRKGAFCRPAAELDGDLVVAAFFNLRRRFCGLWAFCLTWAALQDLRT